MAGSVPSTSTIDLDNLDDRVQPLRYMELGINLNEWEKTTLMGSDSTSPAKLRYTFKINNTSNAHEHHYPEVWYVDIEDMNDDGTTPKYYITYTGTAGQDATAIKTAVTAIKDEAVTRGYQDADTFDNPSGSSAVNGPNRINLATPFVRWQVDGFSSVGSPTYGTHYGYVYIPKVKTDGIGSTNTVFPDQDPDFTKYVNATPSMYTVSAASAGELDSAPNAAISFYILSEVKDGASWKVRGLQEKTAQTVTYPAVESLPMIQIPPLPKIKHVQLEFSNGTVPNDQLTANHGTDTVAGVTMKMMFDESPYLQSDYYEYANQFLIHMKIMHVVGDGAPSPFGEVFFKPQDETIGSSNDLLEPENFFGVYKHTLLVDASDPPTTLSGDFATAVTAVKVESGLDERFAYDDASGDLVLFDLPASLKLSSSAAPLTFTNNFKLFTTDATDDPQVAYTNSHTNPTVAANIHELLAYITLKLPRGADPYGAYRQPDVTEIDSKGIFAMDDFVEHCIVPIHIKIPNAQSLS